MERNITNLIRFVMDETIPPIIRDSKWFMYPFFHYWYKGKNVRLYMEFKDLVLGMTDEEFEQCYRDLDCRATDRPTDLNRQCVEGALRALDPSATTLLDVGCGRGYWARLVAERTGLAVTGCDVFDALDDPSFAYARGSVEALPFEDGAFDIVTCFHTIEHVRRPQAAIDELKRVARRQLMIVTPKQRAYHYSLDLHINYYTFGNQIARLIDVPDVDCRNLGGDWLCIATL